MDALRPNSRFLSTPCGMVPTYVEDSLAEMEHWFGRFIGRG